MVLAVMPVTTPFMLVAINVIGVTVPTAPTRETDSFAVVVNPDDTRLYELDVRVDVRDANMIPRESLSGYVTNTLEKTEVLLTLAPALPAIANLVFEESSVRCRVVLPVIWPAPVVRVKILPDEVVHPNADGVTPEIKCPVAPSPFTNPAACVTVPTNVPLVRLVMQIALGAATPQIGK
jgi:hypothetical protein